MTNTNFSEWIKYCNNNCLIAVAECFNQTELGGWSENHITTEVLINTIGKDGEIEWEDYQQKVRWKAHKLAGKSETAHGDIAVFATIHLSRGSTIKGVAFYEAKRRYYKSDWSLDAFSSIDKSQLANLIKNTHSSHYLFYDVNIADNIVYVTSIPSISVSELIKTTPNPTSNFDIHRYGEPFATMLGRNLLGFNLDFSTEAVTAIENHIKSKESPMIVLHAQIIPKNTLFPSSDIYSKNNDNEANDAWKSVLLEAPAYAPPPWKVSHNNETKFNTPSM